jgi:acetolactate synthase-1/2/3 large subunit
MISTMKGSEVLIVADVLAKAIKKEGVDYIFGYPGGEVTHFIEAARQVGIRFILTKHENTASFMAGAFGEITGKPGVCVSTLGPGATNMATGVANAYLDRAPLIAITGNMNTAISQYATHQTLDLIALYNPITKWSGSVEPESCAQIISKAIKVAKSGVQGPVHLNMASNIAAMEVEPKDWELAPDRSVSTFTGDINQVCEDIKKAKRPIILAGLGVVKYNAHKELTQLAETLRVPVITPPKAKGIIPEDHALSAGVIEMLGDKILAEMIESADLILAIGYDVVELDKQWSCHHIPTINIDMIPNLDQFYPSYCDVFGDIKAIISAMLKKLEPESKWEQKEIDDYKERLFKTITKPSENMASHQVVKLTREIMPRDTIATCDVGAHKMLVGQMWTTYEPRTFLMSNGLSSMGFGLPTAMAAKLLNPEKPVVAIIGDGGFGMSMAELETCVRENIPVIVVILDDRTLSLIRMNQERKDFPSYGVTFGNTDLNKLAESFGAFGAKVENIQDYRKALKRALELNKPAVIQAVVDPKPYRI